MSSVREYSFGSIPPWNTFILLSLPIKESFPSFNLRAVASLIPACATAPALIYVGVLMMKNFKDVDMSEADVQTWEYQSNTHKEHIHLR